MKHLKLTLLIAFLLMSVTGYAQLDKRKSLQYWRQPGKMGLNVFETSKNDTVVFDGVRLRIGGDFALQFQGLTHENGFQGGDPLVDLGSNFNLPSANLNLDVQLADGLRMHLRTYLSSRHHPEAWIKGGYIQMDNLNFIKEGFASNLMDILTIKIGMDEINYGDTHFRRSDNAGAIYNPFVGNYIMDSFTTEPFMELTFQPNDWVIVAGVSNGKLNQSPVKGDGGIVFYGKLGWDSQINNDLRVRLTGSLYSSSDKSTRDYLYGGDRAGARYFEIFATQNGGSDFDPRFNPGFAYQSSVQFNPFVKYKGLEFFGVFEFINDGNDAAGAQGKYNQLGLEGLYRFGMNEQWYLGARYNAVNGNQNENAADRDINRLNLGGGWFMTNNVLLKMEYVNSEYSGDGWAGSKYYEGKFNGVMLEAVIGF